MAKRMKRTKKIRIDKDLTKADVSRITGMQAGTIGWIESGKFTPYDSQLEKLAKALGFKGDPRKLLEEVEG